MTFGVLVRSWFRSHTHPLWCGAYATAADVVDAPAASPVPYRSTEAPVMIAMYRVVPFRNAWTLVRCGESMKRRSGARSRCRTGPRALGRLAVRLAREMRAHRDPSADRQRARGSVRRPGARLIDAPVRAFVSERALPITGVTDRRLARAHTDLRSDSRAALRCSWCVSRARSHERRHANHVHFMDSAIRRSI